MFTRKRTNYGEKGLLKRRDFLKISGLSAGAFALGSLSHHVPLSFSAEGFPSRRITWIVGLPAGGGRDIIIRGFIPFFEKYLKAASSNPDKVEVIIKNITGGSVMRALNMLYHAKPDGYTIALDGDMLHVNTILGTLGFDLFELTYLSRLASANKILVAGAKSGISTWNDILRLSEHAPAKFALSGFGGSNHVATALFIDTTRLSAKIVPFDGTAGANAALMRGDVALQINSEDSLRTLIEAKELQPILTFSEKMKYTSVPNVKEFGFPELNEVLSSQRYIIAPPGVPANIKKILADAMRKAVEDREFLAWKEKTGLSYDPVFSPELDKLVRNIDSFYKNKEKILRELLGGKK